MYDERAWVCECGYSELVVEGDAHGEEALQETLSEMVNERVEELKAGGKVIRDPFTGGDHWMGDPPERYPK